MTYLLYTSSKTPKIIIYTLINASASGEGVEGVCLRLTFGQTTLIFSNLYIRKCNDNATTETFYSAYSPQISRQTSFGILYTSMVTSLCERQGTN